MNLDLGLLARALIARVMLLEAENQRLQADLIRLEEQLAEKDAEK